MQGFGGSQLQPGIARATPAPGVPTTAYAMGDESPFGIKPPPPRVPETEPPGGMGVRNWSRSVAGDWVGPPGVYLRDGGGFRGFDEGYPGAFDQRGNYVDPRNKYPYPDGYHKEEMGGINPNPGQRVGGMQPNPAIRQPNQPGPGTGVATGDPRRRFPGARRDPHQKQPGSSTGRELMGRILSRGR